MFKSISDRITYPDWVRMSPRYKRLDIFDRLLDGTFYDELPHSFYDEKQQNGEPVQMKDKRPSTQYHLPRMVARWASRKLFANRHRPRIFHPDKEVMKRLKKIAKRAKLFETLLEAVVHGSVGSVAVTFYVDKANPDKPVISLSTWRSKYCYPSFNDQRELENLRVCYITSGAALKALGAPGNIRLSDSYWFVRDFTTTEEVTYVPVQKDEWNPVEGFKKEGVSFVRWEDESYIHDLGFVPAQWFVNLSGGEKPDGACTWEDAVPNSIEIDYTLSQASRGVRYNCSPQLVIKGEILNKEGTVTRGPMHYVHLAADKKDAEGNVLGGADAKLLEMDGNGTKVALELVRELRNLALEQINSARKDPEKMKGPLSGRAMEYLDDDTHDLAMELRDQYGEHGMLPLLKKIVQTLEGKINLEPIALQWPRMYQPTPQDIAFLIPALAQAIDPLGAASQKVGGGKEGAPAPKPALPDEKYMILTPEQARAYMKITMDLDLLEEEESEDDEDDEADKPSGRSVPPEPLPVGEMQDQGLPGMFGKIGPSVRVNA